MKIGDLINDLNENRYPAGLFYLNKELWTDEGIQNAADTGADFIVSAESSEPLLSLCEKYKLGIISNSNMKGWWGGDGSNAGKYAEHMPIGKIDELKKSPRIVWGDYIVDEPNSKDFLHINKVVKKYTERFPDKLPFVNLYPNYGKNHEATDDEIITQLGNQTYAEHITQYVNEIDLPYICFDFYPFTRVFTGYVENLRIVADACVKSGKEMWVIIQTGAWNPDQMLSEFQIDWQVYMAMAFGARAIMGACYSKGWWDESTSCVNSKGEKNATYEYIKNIFSILHSSVGTEFLKYKYIGTTACGDIGSAEKRIKPQLEKLIIKPSLKEMHRDFPDIEINSDKAVITGYFKNEDGWAAMIVNTHNPFDSAVCANVKIGTNEMKIMSGQAEFVKLQN